MEMLDYQNNSQLNEDFNIDLKKILLAIWSRKILIIKIFVSTLIFFILLTFILPKKWKVESDLYINKTNNSNMMELNPYAIDELGSLNIGSISDKLMMNELELIQSPIVIDQVIKANDLRFKPLFGFIHTSKTGEYLTTEKFLKQKIKFEIKKGTSIISISYKCKDKDKAYAVVQSIINNYIELHKELNSEKSKFDKKIIESGYEKAKTDLNKKVNAASGLPNASLTGTGQLAAMSAFSNSARSAISNLKEQYLAGEKSRVEIGEEQAKVTQLASKLEWAKLVEEMSDSSNVLVIKEPHPLRNWEYTSPKLFINIIMGLIFGYIFSLIILILIEKTDKNLTYSMLGDKIIYNLEKEFKQFCAYLITNKNKKILFALCSDIPLNLSEKLKTFSNISIVQAGISESFSTTVQNSDQVVMFAQIGQTPSEDYKIIKNMIKDNNKEIAYEVLV